MDSVKQFLNIPKSARIEIKKIIEIEQNGKNEHWI